MWSIPLPSRRWPCLRGTEAPRCRASLGREDRETSRKCIGNHILLTLSGFIFTDGILRLFGVTSASCGYAWDYMRIILLGVPFYVFTSGMNSAIRMDGLPGYSMFATTLGAALNLLLDPVAIFLLHMGVKGAAAATVIG